MFSTFGHQLCHMVDTIDRSIKIVKMVNLLKAQGHERVESYFFLQEKTPTIFSGKGSPNNIFKRRHHNVSRKRFPFIRRNILSGRNPH